MDRNVYDTSNNTYPAMTSGITFSITGATATEPVTVYLNDNPVQVLRNKTSYSFKLIPAIGRNSVQAKSASETSEVTTFSTDLLHTLIYALPRVLGQCEDAIRQSWANGYLSTQVVTNAAGTYILPTAKSLAETWGAWLRVSRLSGSTTAEFVNMLQTVLKIYQQGAVLKSLEDTPVAANATGATAAMRSLMWRSFASTSSRPYVDATGATNVKLIIPPSKVALGNRLYNVARSNPTLYSMDVSGATGNCFVYLEPSSGTTGGTIYEVSISVGDPQDKLATYTETFAASAVQTDTEGKITGLENEKYVILQRVPTTLTSVTDLAGKYGLTGCSRIISGGTDLPTALIDLGTRMDASDVVPNGFTVTYQAPLREIMVLCRVVASGITYNITNILELRGPQYLGAGAVNCTVQDALNSYLLFTGKSGGMTAEEKSWTKTFLEQLSPLGSQGYLFVNRTSGTPLAKDLDSYHRPGYTYGGEI